MPRLQIAENVAPVASRINHLGHGGIQRLTVPQQLNGNAGRTKTVAVAAVIPFLPAFNGAVVIGHGNQIFVIRFNEGLPGLHLSVIVGNINLFIPFGIIAFFHLEFHARRQVLENQHLVVL